MQSNFSLLLPPSISLAALLCNARNNDDEKSSVRVGTADLLDMLLDEEPNANFSFALGADTFMDLTTFKWRRSHDVLDLVGGRLMVIYRQTESAESRYCEKDLQNRIDMVNKERCHDAKGHEEADVEQKVGKHEGGLSIKMVKSGRRGAGPLWQSVSETQSI